MKACIYSRMIMAVVMVLCFFTSSLQAESSLTLGHQVLLERGLQLMSMVFPSQATPDGLDMALWYDSGFTTVDVWQAAYDHGTPYGLPTGDDGLPFKVWATDTSPLVSSTQYRDNLVMIQYGDEQDISSSSVLSDMASAISTLQSKYPNALVCTNQGPGSSGYQVSTVSLSDLLNYTQTVRPDILSFTEYPFRWQGTGYSGQDYDGGSPTSMYVHMEMYRQAGLAGLDGTGSSPIPVHMYTQTYAHASLNDRYPSESEMRLQQFAGWAFGIKAITAFVYNSAMGLDGMFFEGSTQTPTDEYYQYAELNRQSGNLGDALVRLISTDVRMKMGYHKESGSNVMNDLPSSVTAFAGESTVDPYLQNVAVANLGSCNDGMFGDVIVSNFKPLDSSLVEEGAEDDIYFMIVNGLSDSAGDAEDCRQSICLYFDFSGTDITQLLRMSRDTGEVEVVSLVDDGNGLYHYIFNLDGGTGDLFKYDTGTAFVPEPGTMTLLIIGAIALVRKK